MSPYNPLRALQSGIAAADMLMQARRDQEMLEMAKQRELRMQQAEAFEQAQQAAKLQMDLHAFGARPLTPSDELEQSTGIALDPINPIGGLARQSDIKNRIVKAGGSQYVLPTQDELFQQYVQRKNAERQAYADQMVQVEAAKRQFDQVPLPGIGAVPKAAVPFYTQLERGQASVASTREREAATAARQQSQQAFTAQENAKKLSSAERRAALTQAGQDRRAGAKPPRTTPELERVNREIKEATDAERRSNDRRTLLGNNLKFGQYVAEKGGSFKITPEEHPNVWAEIEDLRVKAENAWRNKMEKINERRKLLGGAAQPLPASPYPSPKSAPVNPYR